MVLAQPGFNSAKNSKLLSGANYKLVANYKGTPTPLEYAIRLNIKECLKPLRKYITNKSIENGENLNAIQKALLDGPRQGRYDRKLKRFQEKQIRAESEKASFQTGGATSDFKIPE